MRRFACPLASLVLSFVGGCGAASQQSGAKGPAAEQACFGGKPEVFSTEPIAFSPVAGFHKGLIVVDGHLIWQLVESVAHIDFVKGRGTLANESYLKAADAGEAFVWTFVEHNQPVNKLVAIDLDTGKSRIVIDGRQNRPFPFHSYLVPEGEFLYFIHGHFDGPCEPGKDDGFFRMRRDGAGRPERLGAEPSCATNRFLMAGGYVYWHQFPRHGMPGAIYRRRNVPDAPLEPLATAKSHPLPMALAGGRLYYLDGKRLASVPIDGSAPAVEHFPAEGTYDGATLLSDRGCLYWDAGSTLMRAKLAADGPAAPEVIADQSTYSRDGAIATDGQHLYWMDYDRKRIMRAGRSAKTSP
jgi:hypothetical protein